MAGFGIFGPWGFQCNVENPRFQRWMPFYKLIAAELSIKTLINMQLVVLQENKLDQREKVSTNSTYSAFSEYKD